MMSGLLWVQKYRNKWEAPFYLPKNVHKWNKNLIFAL